MLTIALLQMSPSASNQPVNLEKADEYCRQAASMGADIALMPEMWNVGYCGFANGNDEERRIWRAGAVARVSGFVCHFATLAKELNMAIAVTYLEEWPGAPRNTVTLFDRTGEEVLTYAKVHTCDFATMEAACAPGDGFYVADIETSEGSVRVGAMICYDREHPESARILMLKGAEIILTPNACTLDDLRIHQFQTRAFENALGVAMTNYPDDKEGCNGHSVAFDAQGSRVVEAGSAEGIYLAHFDLEAIRRCRKSTIWGDAYRRPHRYSDLVQCIDKDVFARNNAFGEEFNSKLR